MLLSVTVAKYNKESSRKKKARRPKKPSSEESDDSSDDDSDSDDSDEIANLNGRRHKVSTNLCCFSISGFIFIFVSVYIKYTRSNDGCNKSVFYQCE